MKKERIEGTGLGYVKNYGILDLKMKRVEILIESNITIWVTMSERDVFVININNIGRTNGRSKEEKEEGVI